MILFLFGLLEFWLGTLFVFGCWWFRCFLVRILFLNLFCFLFFHILRFGAFLLFVPGFFLAVGCLLFGLTGDLLMFFLLPFSFLFFVFETTVLVVFFLK